MGFEPLTFSAGSPMKRMVPARPWFSMAGFARSAICDRRLAIARHRIIFGIGHDRRPLAVRPCRGESCRHAARSYFDSEAFGLQPVHIPFGRAIFAPRRLGERPDMGVPLRPVAMAL